MDIKMLIWGIVFTLFLLGSSGLISYADKQAHEAADDQSNGYTDGYNLHNEKEYNYFLDYMNTFPSSMNDGKYSRSYMDGYIIGYEHKKLEAERDNI